MFATTRLVNKTAHGAICVVTRTGDSIAVKTRQIVYL